MCFFFLFYPENKTVQTEAEIDLMLERIAAKRAELNNSLKKEQLEYDRSHASPLTTPRSSDDDLDSYHGPILGGKDGSEPITSDQLLDLYQFIKNDGHLPYKYAYLIISRVLEMFSKLPTVTDVTIPENGRITVVGDLHGQLEDLCTIFNLNGKGSLLYYNIQPLTDSSSIIN
jgi:hypothetical protein